MLRPTLGSDAGGAHRPAPRPTPSGIVGPFPARHRPTRLLVIEDDLLVGLFIQTHLTELGLQVIGPVGDIAGALAHIRAGRLDAALLDLTLQGQPAFAVADALAAVGVPYLMVTAVSKAEIPAAYADRPRLEKPFQFRELEICLDRDLGIR